MEQLTPAATIVTPAVARARIAAAMLDDAVETPQTAGRIRLKEHQISAIARIRAALEEFGGALLCDPVGTGKTFTALAVAPPACRTVIVAPAVLREMWIQAAQVAQRSIYFTSFESLSRGGKVPGDFDFVIVDEAHHARNPAARRYSALAELVSRRKLVLLTATPIHNRRKDLIALISLFLGKRAQRLTLAELGRCVVRRGDLAERIGSIPMVDSVVWCAVEENPRIPKLLLSLPPPVPPRDGGDGGALVSHGLIRQWASSDAALRGGLRRRLIRAEALIAALEDGTWPSKSELGSWISGDDAVQLSFAGFLARKELRTTNLLEAVRLHRNALRDLLGICEDLQSDTHRADLVRRIRSAHPGERIVVFSQHADTIDALFADLSRDGRVAALSGSGATVSGGIISRSDAIGSFAPEANGLSQPHRSRAVTLLLTTDLLSEGVNLQDASVIIHVDLPWTPARIEQRLGRIARIGSKHERVSSYAIAPPMTSTEIVRIDSILKRKIEEAGMVTTDFPSLDCWKATDNSNAPSIMETLRETVAAWTRSDSESTSSRTIAAAVRSRGAGFVALCKNFDHEFLVACRGDVITDDLSIVRDMLIDCEGEPAEISVSGVESSVNRLREWLYARSATPDLPGANLASTRLQRTVLRKIDRAVRRARTSDRARMAELARIARQVVTGATTAHLDNEISSLNISTDDDIELTRRIARLAGESAAPSRVTNDPAEIRALILLVETQPLTPATER